MRMATSSLQPMVSNPANDEALRDSLSGSGTEEGVPRLHTSDTASTDTSFEGALGGKTIGRFGSFALTVNNITGPGMLHLAAVFQKAGLVVPLLCFFLICICSTGAAQLLCDAISRMPGNSKLGVRYEYSDAFRHYIGDRSFTFSQVIFYLGILTQTIASIVGTAQAMDGLIVLSFDRTWGFQVFGHHGTPWFITWSSEKYCPHLAHVSECVPFSNFTDMPPIGCVISAGYIASLCLLAPLGFWNLDDNIKFQIGSFIVLLALSAEFLIDMIGEHGLDPSRVPWFGDDYSSIVGTIMFNFAYCPTIPSWLNEKREEVSVARTLWLSAGCATMLYLFVGIISAMSFERAGQNVLEVLSAGHTWTFTKLCAFLFGVLVVGLGIPVFCIVMRYNLMVGGVCNGFWSTIFGVVLPWMVSWVLYQGKAAEVFISASGVILISLVGFIAPLVLALAAAGVSPVGARGFLGFLRRLWARAPVTETSCSALPWQWLHLQRRYVSILLLIMVPLVTLGLCLQIAQL